MKIRSIVAVLVATIIFISVLPFTAVALWVNESGLEKSTHLFQCSGDGRLDIRFYDTEGSQLAFYGSSGEFIVDGADLADEYLEEGFTASGDVLTVSASDEPVRVAYIQETFGHFRLTATPGNGFRLNGFIDPECGCPEKLALIDGDYRVTPGSSGAIEAVFAKDDSAATAPTGITIKLNGDIITSDVPPFIQNDRTMVPVRFISEALGAEPAWDPETSIVTITAADGTVISLKNGDMNMEITKDGETKIVVMDVATIIKEGRTFIPARFIAEALGLTVGWDGPTRTVLLVSGADLTLTDSPLRFKEEYEALNSVLNSDGTPQYSFVTIEETNKVIYLTYEGLLYFFNNNKSGLLYFGRPGCPWCRRLVPIMLDYAKEDDIDVFYYDIEKDRAENNEEYKTILSLLGDYLPTDTVTQSEGDADFDPGLKRVILPQLFFINNGEVESGLLMFEHEFLRDNETDKVIQLLRDNYAPIATGADSGDGSGAGSGDGEEEPPCDC